MTRSPRSPALEAASMTPAIGLLLVLLAAASYAAGLSGLVIVNVLEFRLRYGLALVAFLSVLLGAAWLCGRGAGHLVASASWADEGRRVEIVRAFGMSWAAIVATELTIGFGLPWLWEQVFGPPVGAVVIGSAIVIGALVGGAWAGRVAAQAFGGARAWWEAVAVAHVVSIGVIVAATFSATLNPAGWVLFLLCPFAYAFPLARRIEADRVVA